MKLWDLSSDSPALVGFMPSAAARKLKGKAKAPAAVTSLALCWEHGVVVAGHRKGAAPGG